MTRIVCITSLVAFFSAAAVNYASAQCTPDPSGCMNNCSGVRDPVRGGCVRGCVKEWSVCKQEADWELRKRQAEEQSRREYQERQAKAREAAEQFARQAQEKREQERQRELMRSGRCFGHPGGISCR
jgi:hypothetical protein